MTIILKISVRFTLKELKCEFSNSFDIISDSEEGGILFLQIAAMFEMKKKKKKKNKNKTKHQIPEFFHKQAERRPFIILTRNRTRRQGPF